VPLADAASLAVVTDPRQDEQVHDNADDAEVVDAIPVPEGPAAFDAAPTVAPRGGLVVASPVAVQAAAVAVTGFAAGAATVAVVRRRRARKALGGRKERKALGEIRASRSFLVDIHLLNNRG
jgi:hypothetical protein